MSFSLHRLKRARGRRWAPSYLRAEGVIENWFRAGDLADGAVASWIGRVEGMVEAQTTGGFQPIKASSVINGKPAITGDAIDDYLSVAAGAGTLPNGTAESWTAIVFKFTSPSPTFGCLYGYGSSTSGQQRMIQTVLSGGVDKLQFSTSGGGITDAGPLTNGTYFAICQWVSGAMAAWINGSPTNPATSVSTFSTATTRSRIYSALGTTPAGVTPYPIADIFILNGRMTTLWRQKLEGWAAWEYGITLPVGHPYKLGPP